MTKTKRTKRTKSTIKRAAPCSRGPDHPDVIATKMSDNMRLILCKAAGLPTKEPSMKKIYGVNSLKGQGLLDIKSEAITEKGSDVAKHVWRRYKEHLRVSTPHLPLTRLSAFSMEDTPRVVVLEREVKKLQELLRIAKAALGGVTEGLLSMELTMGLREDQISLTPSGEVMVPMGYTADRLDAMGTPLAKSISSQLKSHVDNRQGKPGDIGSITIN